MRCLRLTKVLCSLVVLVVIVDKELQVVWRIHTGEFVTRPDGWPCTNSAGAHKVVPPVRAWRTPVLRRTIAGSWQTRFIGVHHTKILAPLNSTINALMALPQTVTKSNIF